MPAQQLEQQVAATSDATGAATFTFAPVPQALTWYGNVRIQSAPFAATFRAVVGAGTGAGDDWGQWQGPLFYGPVACIANRTLQIIATGLEPATTYYATWLGISDNADVVPPVVPMAAPPQAPGFSANPFLNATTVAASYTSPIFPCSNIKGARWSFVNSNALDGLPCLVNIAWLQDDAVSTVAYREIIIPSNVGVARFSHPHLGASVQVTAAPIAGANLSLQIFAAHVDSDRSVWSSVIDAGANLPDALITTAQSIGAAANRTTLAKSVYAGPASFGSSTTGVKYRARLEAQNVNNSWQLVAEVNQVTAVGQARPPRPVIVPAAALRIITYNDDASTQTVSAALIADAWRA